MPSKAATLWFCSIVGLILAVLGWFIGGRIGLYMVVVAMPMGFVTMAILILQLIADQKNGR